MTCIEICLWNQVFKWKNVLAYQLKMCKFCWNQFEQSLKNDNFEKCEKATVRLDLKQKIEWPQQ